MRTVSRRLAFVIVAGVTGGCSTAGTTSDAPATRPADVAAADACVMQSGGANVLRLTVPAGAKCKAADGSLHVDAPTYDVECWLVRGARTVDDAVPRVGPQIADEFRDFKADRTTDLTVAGSPAKRLVGTGHEADDGDPGAADVIVFRVGDRVFVACNHGETINPAGQQGLATLVQTARLP